MTKTTEIRTNKKPMVQFKRLVPDLAPLEPGEFDVAGWMVQNAAAAGFKEALARQNTRTLLPGKSPALVRNMVGKVSTEISTAIYGNPRALRSFAERVRDGAFGDHVTWVYFVGQDADGPIKIGVSDDPPKRLAALQTGSHGTLSLIVAVNGDHGVERTLHGAFAPDRIRGEWFRRSATLLEFMRVLKLTKSVNV